MRTSIHRSAGARATTPPVVASTPIAVRNRAVLATLQRSLRVGRSDDRFEQQADSVAERVMRMRGPAPAVTSVGTGVQRRSGGCPGEEDLQRQPVEEDEEEQVQATPASETLARQAEEEEPEEEIQAKPLGGARVGAPTAAAITTARGTGSRLPAGERSFFEPRFGRSFDNVRIHSDSGAAALASRVNARAFTVGRDVFFGAGEWSPGTRSGRSLLAHELTHTIQQGAGRAGHLHRQVGPTQVTPEEEFLRDMQSGTEKANEYVDYINQSIAFWHEHGIKPARLDDALENLQKITGAVSTGLTRFGRVLGGVQRLADVVQWYDALDRFRAAGRAFNPNDRASVARWAQSMEGLRSRTQPFVEAARDWLGGIASRGSAAAARASLFLSVVSAYAEVGVAALNAGVANVNRYISRQEDYLASVTRAPVRLPPEPGYPGDWSTAAQQRERARQNAAARARHERRQREEQARREMLLSFETEEFPRVYRRRRRWLKRRIMLDMQQRRRPGRVTVAGGVTAGVESVAYRWWRAFTNSGGESVFDEAVGAWVTPKLPSARGQDVLDEIEAFRHVRPACPYFDDLHRRSLAAYVRRHQSAAVRSP